MSKSSLFTDWKYAFATFPGPIPAGREKFQRFHSKLIRTEEQQPPGRSRGGAQPPLRPHSTASPSQGLDTTVLEEVEEPQRRDSCPPLRQHSDTLLYQLIFFIAVNVHDYTCIWTLLRLGPNVWITGAAIFSTNSSGWVFFFACSGVAGVR